MHTIITKLISAALNHRALVVIIFVLIALGAVFSLRHAHIDAIPDIGENQQIVFTEWRGRSPQDIEEQVTYPLSVLLQGIPGVKDIRGTSAFGFSTIYLIFDDAIDFYWSRARILEKLSTAGDTLPAGAVAEIGPDATGLGQIFWYTIENDADAEQPRSLAELRSLQDFYVKYLLQSVEGVSEVSSIGGFVKEYQIDVDPKKLFAFDVHFSALLQAIKNSNMDVGAEVIEDGSREFVVRGRGFFTSLADIENVVIAVRNNVAVRVQDVARVGIGPAFRRGALDKNGTASVGGVVTMRYGENPQAVIDAVKARLQVVEQGLPRDVSIVPFYDRTELIGNTIATVYRALSQEIIITVIVILLFLLHLRASVLVSLTLPFGTGISFILMWLLDIDSNVMSLSGLVIAIGSMVDMGIIMTENIYTSLAAQPEANKQQRLQIVAQAAREVGPAIMTAVMTTIVTFLPVFALEGSEGKLFTPLAWTKTLAMFGSLLVAVVLIPALSAFFLRGKLKPLQKNKLSRGIVNSYRFLLQRLLHRRGLFLFALVPLLAVAYLAFTTLQKEFMPSLNEGDILYMPVTTPDISMTKARELLAYTDRVLNEHQLVEYAVGKLGRTDSALDPAPVAMLETVVKLVPREQWPKDKNIYDIMHELDQALQVPGLVNSWDFPIQTRIGMISTGIKTAVGIKIFGDNLQKLEELAAQIGREVEQVEGAYGVYAERINGKPYIEFAIDRIAAARFGINTGTVAEILQTAVGGVPIGQFYEGRARYPIRVRYEKELRDRIDELKRVLVPAPTGQHIPLEQLAEIKVVTGPAAIQSENGMLRALVLLNVKGRSLGNFVAAAKHHVEQNVTLPPGYALVWAGEYENQVRANRRLMLLVPLVLLINLLIIFLGLGGLRNALIVCSAVPLAMVGGVLLLWAGDFNLSVAVWVGFIALFGITVDNGVVMLTYLQQIIKTRRPRTQEELNACILDAGGRRVRPLLMTTATTVSALLPVMWSTSTGSEVMKPMAIPVLGGMAVQLLTLFLVPVVCSFFSPPDYAEEG